MRFNLDKILDELETTPFVVKELIANLPEHLLTENEGGDSWCVMDILGHLIHGERTDWLPRIKTVMSGSSNKTFKPFDRFAQFEENIGKSVDDLIQEFQIVRIYNIREVEMMGIKDIDLLKEAIHPDLGPVTLRQLLTTWTVHDKAHMAQIYRVLAHQYKNEIGPWKEYMNFLK